MKGLESSSFVTDLSLQNKEIKSINARAGTSRHELSPEQIVRPWAESLFLFPLPGKNAYNLKAAGKIVAEFLNIEKFIKFFGTGAGPGAIDPAGFLPFHFRNVRTGPVSCWGWRRISHLAVRSLRDFICSALGFCDICTLRVHIYCSASAEQIEQVHLLCARLLRYLYASRPHIL